MLNKINKLIPTEAYKYYWKFAAERQNIFFNRIVNNKLDLFTEDKIFQEYKFTNAYRASDRVSQFMIKEVIYNGNNYSNEDVLFRILLFKLFNKIETWEYLEANLKEIVWGTFNYENYNKLLSEYMQKGNVVYSNAYMMPPATKVFHQERKHSNHLLLLEYMMKDNLTNKILNAKSLQEIYNLLFSYPSFGPFLAFQYTIDINYSTLSNFSENDFIVAGPGALDGISKCFKNYNDFSAEYIIKYVTEKQEEEFKQYDLNFQSLWGRKLHLIDCQNLFCEISKYTRVALPNIEGVAKRTRIKQKFKPNNAPIDFFYPPKWNINHLIKGSNDETI